MRAASCLLILILLLIPFSPPPTHTHRHKQAMESAAADIRFADLTEAELRQWVEDHPGSVDDRDSIGETPLCLAADDDDVDLLEWLIDEMGADVNGRAEELNRRVWDVRCRLMRGGSTPLHAAASSLVARALLERNADPTLMNDNGDSVLMWHIKGGHDDVIPCLLEDRRVVALINSRAPGGFAITALHAAIRWKCEDRLTTVLRLLLQAGADPCLSDEDGCTPLQLLRRTKPDNDDAAAVLEEGMDAKRAACLIMIRRRVVAQPGTVELPEGGFTKEEQDWRRLAAYVVGVGEGGGCKKDMFTELVELLLPRWSPLRRGLGQQVVVQAGEKQA